MRKLASDHNVDLTSVKGADIGGRIRRQDVLDAIAAAKTEAAPALTAAPAPAGAPAPAATAAGGDKFIYHGSENLGVAGLDRSECEERQEAELGALTRLEVTPARSRRVSPDELSGGTFALTYAGSRGVLFDTSPNVAILGTGAVVKRPVVVKDNDSGQTIAIRSMVYLAVSHDHRVVDGSDAAQFLTTMKARLEGKATHDRSHQGSDRRHPMRRGAPARNVPSYANVMWGTMVVMKKSSAPEPAVMAGEDPRHYAQVMAAVYEATMAGTKRPARPRDLIGESWRRLRSLGVDPEQGVDELAIRTDELEGRRRDSGLCEVLEDLSRGLEAVRDENIVVVADRKGLVLWRSGSKSVLDLAGKLGFVEGASWAEENVGTNAIGTALISGRAVQIFSAEHYVRSHHPWTCAGAPIRDPHNGRVMGAIDVSGPAKTIHPTTLALVDAVARLAESHLRELHRQTLDRLRSVAAPMLARLSGPGVAVDTDGWVAAVESIAPQNRILLAEQMGNGYAWLPALGPCVVEPLPGGWLLLPVGDGPENGRPSLDASTTLQIDLRTATKPRTSLNGAAGHWSHDLTPRHAEILFVLATERSGLTASALARELFGDEGLAITVRAEMSRLRRHLGGVILAQPYRFDDTLTVLLLLPDDHAQLLPGSCAPAIARARTVAEQPD